VTTLIEFLTARLVVAQRDAETRNTAAFIHETGCYYYNNQYDPAHCDCAGPEHALREVAAKRRVMERHCRYDGTTLYDYCAGCPTGDETGYPDTELKECPELQDLAFIWHDHPDWNQEWCPHVEGRHEEDVTEVPPARGCYTNACNRCGQGDGWHYRNREERAA
jgi:hypothetical protein